MIKLKKVPIDFTVTAGGAYTAEIPMTQGFLYKVFYRAGTLDTGVDITLTSKDTSETLFALTNAGTSNLTKYPRTLQHLNTDGTALTTHDAPLLDGPVNITVAQGGNATSGGIVLYVLQ
jgi:hypothetical protein